MTHRGQWHTVQAILGDRVLYEVQVRGRKAARAERARIKRDPTSEVTSVRILTIDGELVR